MPVLAPSRVVTDPVWPAAANLATPPLRPAPPARPPQAEPSPDALADWQVALLLGGTALGGLATALAALAGLSWLV